MAITIIDALEVVDIQHGDAERALIADEALGFLLQAVYQQAAITQAGQCVVGGGFAQRLVQVAHHVLIAVRDAGHLLQLTQLLVQSLGQRLLALPGHALESVGDVTDAVDSTGQILMG